MTRHTLNWRPDDEFEGGFVRSDGTAAWVRDDVMMINWFQWTRWFHTNFGIGNSEGMWWPSRQGKHSAWVLCDRCGLPFEVPTGFFMTALDPSSDVVFEDSQVSWTGGPCPSCKADGVIATGTPLLTTVRDGHGRTVIAGSPETAARSLDEWRELTRGLGLGEVSVAGAVQKLRVSGGPLMRVADWMEARPVSATAASVIIAAIIGVVGPQLAARQDASSDDEIVQIIDTVLRHYDDNHREDRGDRRPDR